MLESKTDINLSKLYIDGILHVAFVRVKFLALSSWKDYNKYSIELVLCDGKICLEYDNKELWMNVLKELEGVLYP